MKLQKCLYCRRDKSEKEFTLEHVIPQFLGGAQAPDAFKTRRVCKTCNSNLGLFVDASFEKDWVVSNELNEAAYSFFNPEHPSSLPLRHMGISIDLHPPEMQEDEVCECWLGPLGEQIYWIRPSDERMYWYAGGNPRTAKEVETRAYFLLSERSQKNPMITRLAFRDAFIGRKVKKITCTQVDGIDLQNIGFSKPDTLDVERIEYFKKRCGNGQPPKIRLSMYLHYDVRFMAKLAIGLSHVLLDDKAGNSDYSEELHKALWFKEGDPEPAIEWQRNLGQQNTFLKEQVGISHGVTVTILPVSTGVAVNVNLNRRMNWLIHCARLDNIKNFMTDDLLHGLCVVLFKTLNKGITLSLLELLAHNQGCSTHPELERIEQRAAFYGDYFKNL